MIMFYVYVIKSKDYKWYYVGSTKDVEKRLQKHNTRQVKSTKFRSPYELIYTEEFKTVDEARKREKKIKISRSTKEDIIKKFGPIV